MSIGLWLESKYLNKVGKNYEEVRQGCIVKINEKEKKAESVITEIEAKIDNKYSMLIRKKEKNAKGFDWCIRFQQQIWFYPFK